MSPINYLKIVLSSKWINNHFDMRKDRRARSQASDIRPVFVVIRNLLPYRKRCDVCVLRLIWNVLIMYWHLIFEWAYTIPRIKVYCMSGQHITWILYYRDIGMICVEQVTIFQWLLRKYLWILLGVRNIHIYLYIHNMQLYIFYL